MLIIVFSLKLSSCTSWIFVCLSFQNLFVTLLCLFEKSHVSWFVNFWLIVQYQKFQPHMWGSGLTTCYACHITIWAQFWQVISCVWIFLAGCSRNQKTVNFYLIVYYKKFEPHKLWLYVIGDLDTVSEGWDWWDGAEPCVHGAQWIMACKFATYLLLLGRVPPTVSCDAPIWLPSGLPSRACVYKSGASQVRTLNLCPPFSFSFCSVIMFNMKGAWTWCSIDRRSQRGSKNWEQKHVAYINQWNNRHGFIVHGGAIHRERSYREDYLQWLKRNSRLKLKVAMDPRHIEDLPSESEDSDAYDDLTRGGTQPQRGPIEDYLVRKMCTLTIYLHASSNHFTMFSHLNL